MRAKEFIFENSSESTDGSRLSSMVANALPAAYTIPLLPNNDFYKQYRFGVAVASARSAKQRKTEHSSQMSAESVWGENQIIIGYDLDTDIIDDALNIVGLDSSAKKLISSSRSEELSDAGTKSPVQGFKGYER